MGLSNFLGMLSGATSSPTPNPYYGAQLLTPEDHPDIAKPTWVDAGGNVIPDDHASALQTNPSLTSQPFSHPSFWSRLGPVGQTEVQANMMASQYPGQQQVAANTRRTIAEQQNYYPNAANLQKAGYGSANQYYAMTDGMPQSQGDINATAQGQGAFNSGALGPIGAAEAKNKLYAGENVTPLDLANQAYQLQYAQPLVNKLEALRAAGGVQSQPALNDALLSGALREKLISGQSLMNAPIDAGTLQKQSIVQNAEAGRMPTSPIVSSRIGPDGRMMAPSVDPLGVSDVAFQMAGMNVLRNGINALRNGMNGQSGGQVHVLPSGIPIRVPSAPYSETPTVGSAVGSGYGMAGLVQPENQVGPINANPNLKPLQDHPDIMYDNTTGRIYTSQGQDITNDPRYASFKQAAIAQETEQQREVEEADHKMRQSHLKAISDTLKAEHLSSSRASMIGNTLKGTLYDVATGGQPMRNLGTGAANLIGRGYNWLTSDQYQ